MAPKLKLILFPILIFLLSGFTTREYTEQEAKQIDSLTTIVQNPGKQDVFEAYKQLIKLNIEARDTIEGKKNAYKRLKLSKRKKNASEVAHSKLMLSKVFYYTQQKDSMNFFLENARLAFKKLNDTEGVHECEYIDMFNLFTKHEEEEHDKLFALAEKARKRFEKEKDYDELRKIHDSYYVFYMRHASDTAFDYAIMHAKKAVDYAYKTKDTKKIINQLYRLRQPHVYKRDFKSGYKIAVEILERTKELDDELALVKAKLAVAHALLMFDPSEKVETQILECIEVGHKLNDPAFLQNSYGVLASYYNKIEDHQNSVKAYKSAIKYKRIIGDIRGSAISLGNLGEVYLHLNELDSAKKYQKEALAIRINMGITEGEMYSYICIGDIYLVEEDFSTAVVYGEKALKISREKFFNSYDGKIHTLLYKSYKGTNNHKKALFHFEQAKEIYDTLMARNKQKELIELKLDYEEREKLEKQRLIEEKEALIAEQEKAEQRMITTGLIVGVFLLLLILTLVIISLQSKKKSNKVLASKNEEILQQKKQVESAHEELEEKNNEILDSINYAKRIQSAILPPDKLVKDYLEDSFILYKPKDIVAGDFYWMEPKDGKILFAAADCTGHGVPGAMVSVICNNGLNRSVREYGITEPGKILDKTRELVIKEFEKSEEEVKDGMDIALCSLENNTLKYSGAHNPLWVIRKGAEETEETKADKQPIGKFDNPQPHTTHTIALNEGDSFYIFSDGFADQFGGPKGKKFMSGKFKKLLLSIQDKPIQEQKELLNQAFEQWKGELEQLDDVCVIGVRV